METTPEVLIRTMDRSIFPALSIPAILERVRCRALLIHGDDDRVCPSANSQSLAEARPDWEFVTVAGAGHALNVRDPVRVNQLIAEFLSHV
jgi:pimeloyl-ACP methyl ester carboxylesterase